MSVFQNIQSKELQAVFLTIFFGVVFLLVDPFAYHSFTALKNLVFIVGISAFLVWISITKKKTEFGWLAILFALRIIWLASTNPNWLLHPSNDGFYLAISILVLLIAVKNIDEEKFFNTLLWVLLISGLVQSAVGCYQLVAFSPNPLVPIKTPFIGTFGTSNGLGIFLALSFISGVALSFIKRTPYLYACTLLVATGLVFTESRGAILALIVALCSMTGIFVFQRIKKVNQKSIFISAITLVIILSGVFLYRADLESSSGRWMLWEITATMIEDNPVFGVGHGNYSREYLNYQTIYFEDESHAENAYKAANVKQAHNEFFQSFAEGGIVSGVLLISIWISPLFLLIRKLKEESSAYYLARLGIIVAIVTHSLIDSPLHVLPVAIVGYATIATTDNTLLTFPKRLKYVWIALVVAYLAFISTKKGKAYSGHYYWKNGVEYIQKEQWSLAINDLEYALEKLPNKGELLFQVGSAHVFNQKYTRGIYYIDESKNFFNDRNIYLSEAYAQLKLKKYEQARQSALKALSMFPTHLAPHLLLGEIYYYLGDIEESKKSLKKCIDEDISIKSVETRQISEDAKELWHKFYGRI